LTVSKLPKPPPYRRIWWSIPAVVVMLLVIGAAAVAVGWRLGQPPARPAPAATVQSAPTAQNRTEAASPPTASPSPTTPKQEPGVLWQRTGSDIVTGDSFSAPRRWRIVWSFDCRNFAAYGGGNFKLSGQGAFQNLLVQRFAVKAHGTVRVTGGGRGNLEIESVCNRWTVRAIAP
jgi:hypothetical protein